MRILAVDDEPSILELLKAFLEADGSNEVETAASGADALAIIEIAEIDFDCLLLDIQMPEMNGITLCANVRALPDYVHTPIIMLTAMSQKAYIDKAFSVGATDFVNKPFDFLELRYRLKAAAKMVHEYDRAFDIAESARWMLHDHSPEAKPHPDEPLPIDGVDRMVSYVALENFVMALSRTKLLFASTFAIKIADFRKLHDSATPREMRSILKTTAQVIVDHIPDVGNLVSYRGDGVFLCVNQKKTAISNTERMKQINGQLLLTSGLAAARDGRDIQVIVGQEISLVSFSRTGALLAMRRAVDSIVRLAAQVKELSALSKRVLTSQTLTREQFNLERRTYELVLEDIVREESRHSG